MCEAECCSSLENVTFFCGKEKQNAPRMETVVEGSRCDLFLMNIRQRKQRECKGTKQA